MPALKRPVSTQLDSDCLSWGAKPYFEQFGPKPESFDMTVVLDKSIKA